MSESLDQGDDPEVITAIRTQTRDGVEVTLTDGEVVGGTVVTPALHGQIGRLLGLPEVGNK